MKLPKDPELLAKIQDLQPHEDPEVELQRKALICQILLVENLAQSTKKTQDLIVGTTLITWILLLTIGIVFGVT